MKITNNYIIGIITGLIFFLLVVSCNNKDIDVDNYSIEKEEVRPGFDTVYIEGTYDFFKEAESMKINIGQDSTLSDASSHIVTLTGKDYAVTVRNLQANTKYFYNYSVNVGVHNDFIVPTKSFRTLQVQDFTISVSAIPNEGGTVSGGGTYTQGQQCTVTATANEGYTFINWMENDSVISVDSIYRFSVTGNRVLIAKFDAVVLEEYTISVSANPNNGGTVSGGGTYAEGQSCTVRATANTGYTFVNWTENGNQVSSDVNYTFTVNGDRSLVANFTTASIIISATVTPEGSGTITGAGSYENGQSCTLRATANTGYVFEKWTENGTQVSTNATYTFNVTSNRNLVAHFKVRDFTINVSAQPSNGGTVAGGGTYQYGQSCTVTATASSGYTFSCWKENSNVVSTDASYTFSVSGNRNLVASFVAELPTYTITVSANPSEGGSVTGGGTFQQGYPCNVSATANSGYTFANWTENGIVVATHASYAFTVTGNRNLVAHFTANPQSYTITVSANPNNGGTVTGGGTYQQGQSCTVSASANSGYTFTNWTENGNVVSSNASYTFTVTSNRTLVAHFTANPQNYTISVSANPSNGGTVSGGGTYQQGQSCTVHAVANSNYTFTKWTENGTQVSTNANYTFTVTGNRTLVAHFTANPQNYTITVSANPSNGGTVSGGGTYQQGQSCMVSAIANGGYTFVHWRENGNVVSTNASYTFIVTNDRNLVANFQQTVTGDTFSVNFDDSQMPVGWTVIDGGSPQGYGWQIGSTKLGSTGNGHNGSTDFILSQSYDNNYGAVYPDNWFISPAVTLANGSTFSFWACAQDVSYAAEHFGVFVSTTGTNPSDFTLVQEWTLSAKAAGEKAAIRGDRSQGAWRQYTVDLSAYAGTGRHIAIRHFNCSDMFYIDVDDIVLSNAKK